MLAPKKCHTSALCVRDSGDSGVTGILSGQGHGCWSLPFREQNPLCSAPLCLSAGEEDTVLGVWGV